MAFLSNWPAGAGPHWRPQLRTQAVVTNNRVTLNLVETQNITLTLPRELLKQIKRLAADRDTSVSALMVQALSGLADDDRRYSAARRRALAALTEPRALGTNGTVTWSRDELHDRQA